MRTLIIYDDSGKIFMQISGEFEIPKGGLNYIIVNIENGMIAKNVNPITKEVVFEKLPKNQTEILTEKIEMLEKSNLELMEIISNK